MTLGQKIKLLRAERGWTQNELAKRSGLDRGYVAHLEIDTVMNPAADTFLKLARAFNIPVDELFQSAGYTPEPKRLYHSQETVELLLDNIKLNMRRLEKMLKKDSDG